MKYLTGRASGVVIGIVKQRYLRSMADCIGGEVGNCITVGEIVVHMDIADDDK